MQTPDDIRDMYASMGDQAVTQTGALACLFDVADRTVFDLAIAGDYTLRYLAADAVLEEGDQVTIAGSAYRLVADPQRINAHEVRAALIQEPV